MEELRRDFEKLRNELRNTNKEIDAVKKDVKRNSNKIDLFHNTTTVATTTETTTTATTAEEHTF